MKKQTLNEEFKRMQKLAGLINENESNTDYTKSLATDYDSNEVILDELFMDYNLEDPEEFREEMQDEGASDAMTELAYKIASNLGFKGDLGKLMDDETGFYRYCLKTARQFILQFGADMGVVDENDPEFISAMKKNETWWGDDVTSVVPN